MNLTKIEWTERSWNPITGCLHGCWYCYAKKMYRRFPALGNPNFTPKFFSKRLKELSKLKKPSKIFVCSTADLFADWTKPEWREKVLAEIKKYPQHTYQLLTKNPENINKKKQFGKNVWVGTTVTCQEETKNISEVKRVQCGIRFVSFEPLLGQIYADLSGIDWIIIGKLTGSKKVFLQDHWVDGLIRQARYLNIPIFVKNNVNWHKKIQEFPKTKEAV